MDEPTVFYHIQYHKIIIKLTTTNTEEGEKKQNMITIS